AAPFPAAGVRCSRRTPASSVHAWSAHHLADLDRHVERNAPLSGGRRGGRREVGGVLWTVHFYDPVAGQELLRLVKRAIGHGGGGPPVPEAQPPLASAGDASPSAATH